MTQDRRLMLIELNEFSVDLFQQGVRELSLPHVERLLSMSHATTRTDDQIEHRGLDPWVQWVSVHTGLPSSVHKVIHLGDAPAKLGCQQLWETLSACGVSSGVWGAMNATRGNASQCQFFLPDPWTFMEKAYPPRLNDLLALPRYYSKNYLDVSIAQFVRNTMRLVRYVFGSSAIAKLLAHSPFLLAGMARTGLTNAFLFSAFDLFSAALFIAKRRKHSPQLSLIFLNSIAHLQHHRWEKGATLSRDLAFGLRTIDRVLGMLFADLAPGEALVVMNALTQKNIVGEKPRICYRQINPQAFLHGTGLAFQTVEQLMTNDAHVFFSSRVERDAAATALSAVKLDDQPFFHVEPSPEDECKLFFQIDFWEEVESGRKLQVNGRTIEFDSNFEAIVARTGAHVNHGNVFYAGVKFPSSLYNHEVGHRIAQWFESSAELGVGSTPSIDNLVKV